MDIPQAPGMRRRILQEAAVLFARSGYNAVSTRQIAEACGITKAALYYHFVDKENLLAAILSENLDVLIQLIASCRSGLPDARGRLQAFVQAVFAQPAEQRAIIRLASQELPNLTPEFRARFSEQYHRQFIGSLAVILEDGMRAGELKSANPLHAAWLLLGMMYPFFYPGNERQAGSEPASEWILSVFFEGMAAHA